MQLDWQLKFCPILLIKEGEWGGEGEQDETDNDEKTKTEITENNDEE